MFWYNYVKPKYRKKQKHICAIAEHETIFDTSNYELDRPLPNGKN